MMAPVLAALPWKAAVPLDVVERAVTTVSAGAVPARLPMQVSQAAHALAADVLAQPWDFLNARYVRLGISGRPGQQAKNELVALGWVKEHMIPRRGRPPILLEPLPALANATRKSLPSWGKGGFLHAFVAQTVMEKFRLAHYTGIQKEKFYGSKSIDIVATDSAGNLVGVEVSISLTNLIDNFEKDFLVQPQLYTVIAVCFDSKSVRQAQRAITFAPGLKPFLSRIQVEPIAKWL